MHIASIKPRRYGQIPIFTDIQSNIIDILNTRLVIPLFDSRLVKKPLPVRLNP